ncbi:lytic transglycosylase domain-containing protein [Ferruginivarius sediminum]|uniref:Lytic transglycosylase domain-containing protein n=1 Tax=Ferruginivarius sediminum TaxID=2661937 RepID=A0A369T9K6_9PROT|nr:lytic transglycosylase domain-containing protein [Ferruginivarius sediminum]RDD61968.1 lytic transglycosylase domain-containing protein [Ferruginivarius sediminum]
MKGAILRCAAMAMVIAAVFALPAGATSPEGEETAVATAGLPGHPLPAVLSDKDVELYRRMFELGEPGRWDEVDRLIGKLGNKLLLGHVLAQRYLHPTKYRTPFHELRDWLRDYHDHPQAERLYKLAQRRRPSGAGPVHRNTYTRGDYAGLPARMASKDERTRVSRTAGQRRKARRILRRVGWNVLNTRLTITERYLEEDEVASLLTADETAKAYARVAAGWYYYGNDDKAFALAQKAAARAETCVSGAHWIGGLAGWRKGKLDAAATHFEGLAGCEFSSERIRAAGAYWAARVHLRLRQPDRMSHWLRRAAAHPRTFYGQLAHRALGTKQPLRFDPAAVDEAALTRLLQDPAGRRAIALLQLGERERARRELLGVQGWSDPKMAGALLIAAERGGLSALAFRLAQHLADAKSPEWSEAAINAALYPLPPYRPATGFQVDRALLYAMMRQESGFNPDAKSGAGARGLMQLMPATASFVARRDNFVYSRRALYRPDLNLDLAQRYVAHLLGSKVVGGNLFNLAAAYNGGPGNLAKWRRETAFEDDPLLFIESLPSRETRLFVERVLTNLWIYRQRLGQPAPSLKAIAAGDWPRYQPLDRPLQEVAQK